MIELHLRGRTAAGRRDDLIAFLREAIPFYEQPGGIRVRLMWDTVHPDRFIEVVEYDNQDSHDLDQARVAGDPQMLDYLRRWRDLLAEPPQVETYRHDLELPVRSDDRPGGQCQSADVGVGAAEDHAAERVE